MSKENNLPDTAHHLNKDDRGINTQDVYDFEQQQNSGHDTIDHNWSDGGDDGYFPSDSNYFSNPII